MTYCPRLESLEPRDLTATTVLSVGPGMDYATPDQVPWASLQPDTEVDVYWQAAPYHSKINIPVSGISVVGISGPAGQLPVLDGADAQENADASYFSTETFAEGVISIQPGDDAPPSYQVSDVTISGLEIRGASRDNSYTAADGSQQYYNWGAAGIDLYRAAHITIEGCDIHDNENGIFGKSDDGYGAIAHVAIRNNHVHDNGVATSDRYHNAYLEAWGLTCEFNRFDNPIGGGNVDDRSFDFTFRYNYVSGGAYLLGMGEPEDAPNTLVYNNPAWGKPDLVYGNVLVNPPDNWSANLIWFGGVNGDESIYRQNLWFYDNTVVSQLDQSTRWTVCVFKDQYGVQDVSTYWIDDNIFVNEPAEAGSTPSTLSLINQYGTFHFYANLYAGNVVEGDGFGAAADGFWEHGLFTDDPGMLDPMNGDYRLLPTSAAVGAADTVLADQGAPAAAWQWDPLTGTWTARETAQNLGGIETDAPASVARLKSWRTGETIMA